MEQRRIGDLKVGAIGLGAMPMSSNGHPDEARSIRTVHAALDQGVNLIDTADAYTPNDRPAGHNEELVAKALRQYSSGTDHVVVATKGGHTRDGADWGVNGRPEYLRQAAEESCRRLGVDAIDLYQHHRPDPEIPYAETMGGLEDLLVAGLIKRAGISNADPDQIREAYDILGDDLVSVQNQLSPRFRSSEPELQLCNELGIAFLPWSPLGGSGGAKELGSRMAAFAEVGQRQDVSPQRVCLAWLLAKAPVVIPIPGASRPESVLDSMAAVDLELSDEDVALLDSTAPEPAGS
ncbi:MAG: aldo/keto reductase [Actinomycetota bacterium]|nr:aldo/keto reductase [Actinomycetota bacterium]